MSKVELKTEDMVVGMREVVPVEPPVKIDSSRRYKPCPRCKILCTADNEHQTPEACIDEQMGVIRFLRDGDENWKVFSTALSDESQRRREALIEVSKGIEALVGVDISKQAHEIILRIYRDICVELRRQKDAEEEIANG